MKYGRHGYPKYCHAYRDRHGKWCCDYRRGSLRRRLPTPHLGNAFWEAWRQANADYVDSRSAQRIAAGRLRRPVGSIAYGVALFIASTAFAIGLAASSQKKYRSILGRFAAEFGEIRLDTVRSRHVELWLEEQSGPGAAASLLKALRRLFPWLVKHGLMKVDPSAGLAPPAQRSREIHSWTETEIETYRRRHAPGSRPRLALELLLNTGQRRGDVIRMGWQHVRPDPERPRGRLICIVQQKTGILVEIPMMRDLATALDTLPKGNLTFLMNGDRPFTSSAFGYQFGKWCTEAGLVGVSPHGLRKACGARLAEAGCTPHQIAKILGHSDLRHVALYTKGADALRLARDAIDKLESKIGLPG
jgi:integrase